MTTEELLEKLEFIQKIKRETQILELKSVEKASYNVKPIKSMI